VYPSLVRREESGVGECKSEESGNLGYCGEFRIGMGEGSTAEHLEKVKVKGEKK